MISRLETPQDFNVTVGQELSQNIHKLNQNTHKLSQNIHKLSKNIYKLSTQTLLKTYQLFFQKAISDIKKPLAFFSKSH